MTLDSASRSAIRRACVASSRAETSADVGGTNRGAVTRRGRVRVDVRMIDSPGSECVRRCFFAGGSETTAVEDGACVSECLEGLHRGWQAWPGPCLCTCFTVLSRRPQSSHAAQPAESTRGLEQAITCGSPIHSDVPHTGALITTGLVVDID